MIDIRNLTYSYTGAPPYILENLSLTIEDGAYVSVLGENGTGKSTLIRLMLGLLRPQRGSVECAGARIGYVPQRNDFSFSQFPITVIEMLDSYRRLQKIPDRGAVANSLRLVHMEEHGRALLGTLSGGQAQKILLARALMGSPGLLILDEPSTGVDVASQKEIYALLRQLNREGGMTIVSVEHNLEAAIASSTLIFHLADGRGHLCTPQKYAAEFLGGEPEEEHDA